MFSEVCSAISSVTPTDLKSGPFFIQDLVMISSCIHRIRSVVTFHYMPSLTDMFASWRFKVSMMYKYRNNASTLQSFLLEGNAHVKCNKI